MAKRKISFSLSEKSIDDAIKQIEEYKQSINKKLETFVSRLTDIGIQTVNAVMMSVAPVDRGEYNTEVVWDKNSQAAVGAKIQLKGDQVLFIEFSSGITFGTKSFPALPNNPNYGSDYGMGTYNPDSPNWNNPQGWWYKGKWGEKEHTYGIRAYAPMYNADMEMRRQIQSIAKEVFGG